MVRQMARRIHNHVRAIGETRPPAPVPLAHRWVGSMNGYLTANSRPTVTPQRDICRRPTRTSMFNIFPTTAVCLLLLNLFAGCGANRDGAGGASGSAAGAGG